MCVSVCIPSHRCVHAAPHDALLMQDAARAWALVRVLLAFVEEVPEACANATLGTAAHVVQVCF